MVPIKGRKRIKRVQVILKVAERCNLACSYCYYFEGGDRTFLEKPPLISEDTVRELAKFLAIGVDELELDDVWISFHGGEPFLLKPRSLDVYCGIFQSALGDRCKLVFSAQTNGLHVSDAMLGVINKYRIAVSVSIDGLKEEHDRERVDHKGRGSFDRIKANYVKLAKNSSNNQLHPIEIISVLDARNDYRATISGLQSALGVQNFNFLLPDCTRDGGVPGGRTARDYGKVLCDIFDSWAESDSINVREVDEILRRFQVAVKSQVESINRSRNGVRYIENQVIVVRSDGELQIDDTYMPAHEWRNDLVRINLRETSLADYLSLPVFDEIDEIYEQTPDDCRDCIWQNICNGGDIENRYSIENGFNNPSVYCSGLKMFYFHVAIFLRRNGYSKHVLEDRLRGTRLTHVYSYAK